MSGSFSTLARDASRFTLSKRSMAAEVSRRGSGVQTGTDVVRRHAPQTKLKCRPQLRRLQQYCACPLKALRTLSVVVRLPIINNLNFPFVVRAFSSSSLLDSHSSLLCFFFFFSFLFYLCCGFIMMLISIFLAAVVVV